MLFFANLHINYHHYLNDKTYLTHNKLELIIVVVFFIKITFMRYWATLIGTVQLIINLTFIVFIFPFSGFSKSSGKEKFGKYSINVLKALKQWQRLAALYKEWLAQNKLQQLRALLSKKSSIKINKSGDKPCFDKNNV